MGHALWKPHRDRSGNDRGGHERGEHHDDHEASAGPTTAHGVQTTQHRMERRLHFFSSSAKGWSSSICWETTFTIPRIGIASSRPHTPQSQPQKSNAINTATAFIFAIWPVIQVMTNMPTKVAIASELPDTTSAIQKDSNCMKPTIPVAIAISAGPK